MPPLKRRPASSARTRPQTVTATWREERQDPLVKKMTKKQRKAHFAANDVADDSYSVKEVGVVVDAAVVPPMKESRSQWSSKSSFNTGLWLVRLVGMS
jgi:hypothetical protein